MVGGKLWRMMKTQLVLFHSAPRIPGMHMIPRLVWEGYTRNWVQMAQNAFPLYPFNEPFCESIQGPTNLREPLTTKSFPILWGLG